MQMQLETPSLSPTTSQVANLKPLLQEILHHQGEAKGLGNEGQRQAAPTVQVPQGTGLAYSVLAEIWSRGLFW